MKGKTAILSLFIVGVIFVAIAPSIAFATLPPDTPSEQKIPFSPDKHASFGIETADEYAPDAVPPKYP